MYEETTGMDTGPLSRTLAFTATWRQDYKGQWERGRETEEPSLTFEHLSERKIQCREGEWPRRVLWACSGWVLVHRWTQGRLCGKQAAILAQSRESMQICESKSKRALIVRVLRSHGRVPDLGRHITGSGSRKTTHMKMETVLGAGA